MSSNGWGEAEGFGFGEAEVCGFGGDAGGGEEEATVSTLGGTVGWLGVVTGASSSFGAVGSDTVGVGVVTTSAAFPIDRIRSRSSSSSSSTLVALAAPPDVELRSNNFLLLAVVVAASGAVATVGVVLSTTPSEPAGAAAEPVTAVAAKNFQKRPSSAGWDGPGAVSFVTGV